MTNGGKRPGAGRPKGSTTRPQIRSYFTDKEIREVIDALKKRMSQDPQILKFVAEQIFGKATQTLNTEDADGVIQPITGVIIMKDEIKLSDKKR